MPDSDREAVARAICLQASIDDGYGPTKTLIASIEAGMWRNHLGQATAAISALEARGWRKVEQGEQ